MTYDEGSGGRSAVRGSTVTSAGERTNSIKQAIRRSSDDLAVHFIHRYLHDGHDWTALIDDEEIGPVIDALAAKPGPISGRHLTYDVRIGMISAVRGYVAHPQSDAQFMRDMLSKLQTLDVRRLHAWALQSGHTGIANISRAVLSPQQ